MRARLGGWLTSRVLNRCAARSKPSHERTSYEPWMSATPGLRRLRTASLMKERLHVRLEDQSTGSARCFLFDFRERTAYVAVRLTRGIVIKQTPRTPKPEESLALGDKRIAAASTVRRGEGPKSPDLRLPMVLPTPSKPAGFCDRPAVIGRRDATSPQRAPIHRPKRFPSQPPLRPIKARKAS
jgi:hypothetical protein